MTAIERVSPGDDAALAAAVAVMRACDAGTPRGEGDVRAAAAREPRHALFVARGDAGAAAAELATVDSWDEPERMWLTLWAPAAAGAAAPIEALWDAVATHAAAHGVMGLRAGVRADRPGVLAVLAARGMREVERSQSVVLRLTSRPADPTPPAGVRLVSLARRPALLDQILAIDDEAVPDIPGESADPPGAAFWRAKLEGGQYMPATVVAAVEHDVAVAYAVLRHYTGRPDFADHEFTGTLRAARGRGLATLVKRAQSCAAWDAGVRELRAWNHLDNAPMRAVNAALGYVRGPDVISLVLDRPPRPGRP